MTPPRGAAAAEIVDTKQRSAGPGQLMAARWIKWWGPAYELAPENSLVYSTSARGKRVMVLLPSEKYACNIT